jgi:hypothetical protein
MATLAIEIFMYMYFLSLFCSGPPVGMNFTSGIRDTDLLAHPAGLPGLAGEPDTILANPL